nr:hypothetical protein BaRGS_023856 [Batillaria attramentaria]
MPAIRKLKPFQHISPFLSRQSLSVKLAALMALAALLDEQEGKQLTADGDTLQIFLSHFQEACRDEKRRSRLRGHFNLYVDEFLRALYGLVKIESIKRFVFEMECEYAANCKLHKDLIAVLVDTDYRPDGWLQDVLHKKVKVVVDVTDSGSREKELEKLVATLAFLNLTNDSAEFRLRLAETGVLSGFMENIKAMLHKTDEYLPLVSVLESGTEEQKRLAVAVIWELAFDPENSWQIRAHTLLMPLVEKLKVSVDSTLAQAAHRLARILQTTDGECEYAASCKLHKDLIAVLVDTDYRPDGWLQDVLHKKVKVVVDVTDSGSREKELEKLVATLGDRGKGT